MPVRPICRTHCVKGVCAARASQRSGCTHADRIRAPRSRSLPRHSAVSVATRHQVRPRAAGPRSCHASHACVRGLRNRPCGFHVRPDPAPGRQATEAFAGPAPPFALVRPLRPLRPGDRKNALADVLSADLAVPNCLDAGRAPLATWCCDVGPHRACSMLVRSDPQRRGVRPCSDLPQCRWHLLPNCGPLVGVGPRSRSVAPTEGQPWASVTGVALNASSLP